jgi:RNA polymerase sigma factor (TIGR02999 family)
MGSLTTIQAQSTGGVRQVYSRRSHGGVWTQARNVGMMQAVSDVTHILEAMQRGESQAAGQLLTLVYEELRRIAAHKMAQEPPGHTLQATALVHEAWLRMLGDGNGQFAGRAHFFAVAAEAMRRILVESARRKRSLKRGAGAGREELTESHLVQTAPSDEMLAVDEALDLLGAEDPTCANLVKLRFFVGMTMEEAATALGLPLRTAERLWTYSRAWLRRSINAAS